MTKQSPKIALTYEKRSIYLDQGYSEEQVGELPPDEEIDCIAAALESLGYQVSHVPGIEALVQQLARGEHKQWDFVFNTAEGMHGSAREAQIPALLEAFQVPFTFSDASTLALCLDKGRTKILLEHYGIPTAPFAIVRAIDDSTCDQFPGRSAIRGSPHAASLSSYPLFVKPNAEGTSKGILPCSKVYNQEELEQTIRTLKAMFPGQDLIIERFLTGWEYTVGIVGTGSSARVVGVIGFDEAKQDPNRQADFVDWTTKQEIFATSAVKADMNEPGIQNICKLALDAWRALGCRDGGRIDVRSDANSKPYILEVNPIAGLDAGCSALPRAAEINGVSYQQLMESIVNSALERKKGPLGTRN